MGSDQQGDVVVTAEALRQVVRNVLTTPPVAPPPEEGFQSTVPTHDPPIEAPDRRRKKRKETSLGTEYREGIKTECTLQETVDAVKRAQRDGMVRAPGERRIKDSASPATGRLLEANAIEKSRMLMKLGNRGRSKVILRAARDFESKDGRSLDLYPSVGSLPESARTNLDGWVLPEYREDMIRTGALLEDEVQLLRSGAPRVNRALLEGESYKSYRERFWTDVRMTPHAWIFFDEFKAFMKPYWEGKR